ncbi:MAG: molybdopterin-binding protein [Pelatocladus maniniholoensis HA4357-MV3]|jgi:molybdopterin-binding protein|uniref:Molybdopterin-binding protein n=1 Tax=Pelatocladus maniniholoensis HA4357-MV3 TaxID=1117104 RepID=A0A9E3HD73_9NOST|nr:molybdopterin-binding protein [Pelatocladus maniniholoensis HA4357-MV3]BAZ67487.1 TOBE domain-containing protein [Fischerella sp. NIES-4106]
MPRKEQGWITFQTSEEERKMLEEFCQQSQRTKTEVLREFVRSLNKESSVSSPVSSVSLVSLPTIPKAEDTSTQLTEVAIQKKPLKVSSRNVLKGVVTQIVKGPVNSEVTLEIVHKVQLTSVITKVSSEELELIVGEEAYAVIKSTDIVIAKE